MLYVPGSKDSKEIPARARKPEPSFTTCPYCLGLGEKHEGNASQPAVTCSWCGGRGFLKGFPSPDELCQFTRNGPQPVEALFFHSKPARRCSSVTVNGCCIYQRLGSSADPQSRGGLPPVAGRVDFETHQEVSGGFLSWKNPAAAAALRGRNRKRGAIKRRLAGGPMSTPRHLC
jgi:hypothetical protein